MEACKSNDRRAQHRLYKLYSQAMYNICFRMLGNDSDAEDVLQNAFIDVFTKLHMFRFESSIGAWIKRIVVNQCINFLKKRKLDLVPLEDREPFLADPQLETLSDPFLQVDTIKSMIPQLPEGYRVIFTLYLLEGYDHVEISEILGISVSTSKSQLNRAKAKLRKLILDNNQINIDNARPA